jgi:hypothetical protein
MYVEINGDLFAASRLKNSPPVAGGRKGGFHLGIDVRDDRGNPKRKIYQLFH